MTVVLILFATLAILLWLSTVGYLTGLGIVAFSRRKAPARVEMNEWPPITVVVATVNEERLILRKLSDLRRADYPHEQMTIVVVDGGSSDRTTALVQAEIKQHRQIQLVRLDRARGKADQLNHILSFVRDEIVVFTDVDAMLEPSCVRELVRMLHEDQETAVVGATVRPDSPLLEERIYWWFLNYLWWLEGEVLSAAMVSGVCYAVRRTELLSFACDSPADDIHLALGVGARGLRVRTCRRARATEVRVPRTRSEFLRFRQRRGADYRRELLRTSPPIHAPAGWRLARALRLFHFRLSPVIGAGVLPLALVVLLTPYWWWPVVTFIAFAAPACAALFASTTLARDNRHRWRLALAAGRLAGLTWLSLLKLDRAPSR